MPLFQSLSGSTGSSSSGGGGGHVTKVTATAKFKLELHTPVGGGASTLSASSSDSRPPSSGGGRRSRRSSFGSSGGSTVLPPPPADPLRTSGEHSSSVSSSLSSDGGLRWFLGKVETGVIFPLIFRLFSAYFTSVFPRNYSILILICIFKPHIENQVPISAAIYQYL